MKKFNVNKLPSLTKSIFESHQKWSDKNWKDTLNSHSREIEKLFGKIGIFDQWKKLLGSKYGKVAKELIPEMFMDSYLSLHFVCMGLYKQANICARAQLETALRLVYFSSHKIEYGWWYKGNEWYLSSSKDVWGKGYGYFEQLEQVKNFDKELQYELFQRVRNIYGKLSKYVHSGAQSFQTSPERISPKYKIADFKKWILHFKEVQTYVNVILAIGFDDVFKESGDEVQRQILRVIENKNCKEALRKSLKLRLRGRV